MLFNRKPGFSGGVSQRRPSAARRNVVALGIVGLLLLSLTAVASADTVRVRFTATAPVVGIGLDIAGGGGTQAEFTVDNKGEIKKVVVNTIGEIIAGGPVSVTSCEARRGGDEFCDALENSGVLSFHDSTATIKNPTIIPVEIAPGVYQQQLMGVLKGHLDSDFSISQPDGQLMGGARLRIDGQGSYGCYTFVNNPASPFWPENIAVCQGAEAPAPLPPIPGLERLPLPPMLIPTSLLVDDNGQFNIQESTGVFDDIEQVKGRVNVSLTAVGGGILAGSINITNGRALLNVDDDGGEE